MRTNKISINNARFNETESAMALVICLRGIADWASSHLNLPPQITSRKTLAAPGLQIPK